MLDLDDLEDMKLSDVLKLFSRNVESGTGQEIGGRRRLQSKKGPQGQCLTTQFMDLAEKYEDMELRLADVEKNGCSCGNVDPLLPPWSCEAISHNNAKDWAAVTGVCDAHAIAKATCEAKVGKGLVPCISKNCGSCELEGYVAEGANNCGGSPIYRSVAFTDSLQKGTICAHCGWGDDQDFVYNAADERWERCDGGEMFDWPLPGPSAPITPAPSSAPTQLPTDEPQSMSSWQCGPISHNNAKDWVAESGLCDGHVIAKSTCESKLGGTCVKTLCGSCAEEGYVKEGDNNCGGSPVYRSVVFEESSKKSTICSHCGWGDDQDWVYNVSLEQWERCDGGETFDWPLPNVCEPVAHFNSRDWSDPSWLGKVCDNHDRALAICEKRTGKSCTKTLCGSCEKEGYVAVGGSTCDAVDIYRTTARPDSSVALSVICSHCGWTDSMDWIYDLETATWLRCDGNGTFQMKM